MHACIASPGGKFHVYNPLAAAVENKTVAEQSTHRLAA